jgi:shikimate kinase
MGAGKSTVASGLAARLEWPWRDSDADIEAVMGCTGRAIAADPTMGVDTLHALEEAVLLGALAASAPTVISAAAWVVESALCRAAMRRRARVVWLRAPVEVLRQRMATGTHRRTSARGELEALVARRTPMFEGVADVIVDALLPPHTIIDHALHELR